MNAKQIYNIDASGIESTLQAEGFYLNKKTADLYINGIVDGFALSHNSEGYFVVRLSKYLAVTWYSVFDFGRNPSGGNLIIDVAMDGTSANLYSIFGYQSDTEVALRWGVLKMKTADGTVLLDGNSKPLAKALVNGIELSRNSTRDFY